MAGLDLVQEEKMKSERKAREEEIMQQSKG
jgi:hypothetical protein